jgi:hypothetical protein
MTPKIRSFSGAALMLVIIPIIAGLLACMPVPIGDPERSRIDPDLNGVWLLADGDDLEIYQFLPWDKRSWLLLGTEIEAGEELDGELPQIETPEDYAAALENLSIGKNGITARSVVIYKVWLAKLGGETFMTWEMTGFGTEKGRIPPEYWFVFKLEKVSADEYRLFMLNAEFDGFADIPSPKEYEGDDYVADHRRLYERVIKRNLDNENLISDEAVIVLRRLPASASEDALELFEEVIEFE